MVIETNIEEIIYLLNDSVQLIPSTNEPNYYILDNSNVDTIIALLKQIVDISVDNKWIYDTFVIVCFHQSLPNCKMYENYPILSKQQIKDIFDVRLLDLMRIMMINDSYSHSGPDHNHTSEINSNLNKIKKYL